MARAVIETNCESSRPSVMFLATAVLGPGYKAYLMESSRAGGWTENLLPTAATADTQRTILHKIIGFNHKSVIGLG